MPNLVRKLISAIIRVNTTNQRQKNSVKLIVCGFTISPSLILINLHLMEYKHSKSLNWTTPVKHPRLTA